jgi:hypothetical protein
MTTELLALILGGGFATLVGAVVQAYRSIRDGSRTQERDAYADLEAARKKEFDSREWAEIERDYWHSWAAELEYFMLTKLPREQMPIRPPFPRRPAEESAT